MAFAVAGAASTRSAASTSSPRSTLAALSNAEVLHGIDCTRACAKYWRASVSSRLISYAVFCLKKKKVQHADLPAGVNRHAGHVHHGELAPAQRLGDQVLD